MSKRKPHNDLAGYVFEYKHRYGHIVCYIAEEAGLDADDKYIIVIEAHHSMMGPSFPSLPKARAFVKDELAGQSGYDWN